MFAKEWQLNLAKDKGHFKKMCADMERDTGTRLGLDTKKLRQYVLKGEYEIIQTSTAYSLGSMFQSALDIAGTLQGFGYEVLYALWVGSS